MWLEGQGKSDAPQALVIASQKRVGSRTRDHLEALEAAPMYAVQTEPGSRTHLSLTIHSTYVRRMNVCDYSVHECQAMY